jgi:hypothetical protein
MFLKLFQKIFQTYITLISKLDKDMKEGRKECRKGKTTDQFT